MAEYATIARPYAKALFELAEQKAQIESWSQQLGVLAHVAARSDVASIIGDPVKSARQHADDLLAIAGAATPLDDYLQNAVRVISENKRLSALSEISAQFNTMMLAKKNYQEAVIYSAFPMTEAQFSKITSDLEQRFNTKLHARLEIDPSLIGGIKIEMGDQVLDMSVQAKLNKLHAAMIN